jgi:hypothetical protein
MAIIGHKEELSGDHRLTDIAKADTKKWYQKPNLRLLYLTLLPCALGVEMTSGYDSSMMVLCRTSYGRQLAQSNFVYSERTPGCPRMG